MTNGYMMAIAPLSEADGGGFLAYFPDLPGCQSDGETPEEAAVNAQDALAAWLAVQRERQIAPPPPGTAAREAQEYVGRLERTAASRSAESTGEGPHWRGTANATRLDILEVTALISRAG